MKRNAEGRVTNLEVLVPTSVIVKVSESGVYTYEYGDQRFTTRDIKHLSLMRVPGYVYGLGPIQKVRGELEQSLDLRTYTGSWFSSSGMATGVLKTDQSLTQEQADAYKERWGEVINGKDRTAILGNGLSYQSTYLNPKDALFIEAVNANLQQIARMFGIPASLLSLPLEGNSLTYSNVQDELNQFYKFTLTAYLNEIENALTDLIPRGQTVRFDPANLMRLSPQDRYANYKTAIDSGWLSPDEVRKMEGLKGPAPKKEPQPQPMGDVGAPDKGEAVNKEEENEDM